MATLSVTSLFTVTTTAKLLAGGLAVARILGLPTESWRTGDPTKSLYKYLAEALNTLETTNAAYVKAGFLSSATGDWLTVLALEVYNVTRTEESFATPTVTMFNSGGGLYVFEVGDLTFQDSSTNKTYHNTDAGTISPNGTADGTDTLTLALIADEGGSDSSVGANAVDTLVTTQLGVAVTSSTAATGIDEEDDTSLVTQCNSTLGALSPNGPADAYEYVVRSADLTGVDDITRAKSSSDSTTGTVTVYVASSSGAVAAASVIAAQTAVETWAQPLAMTATVINATATTVAVTGTYTAKSGETIPTTATDSIATAMGVYFSALDIGESVAVSALINVVHEAVSEIGSLTLTLPAADVSMTDSQVPTVGTLTITEAS